MLGDNSAASCELFDGDLIGAACQNRDARLELSDVTRHLACHCFYDDQIHAHTLAGFDDWGGETFRWWHLWGCRHVFDASVGWLIVYATFSFCADSCKLLDWLDWIFSCCSLFIEKNWIRSITDTHWDIAGLQISGSVRFYHGIEDLSGADNWLRYQISWLDDKFLGQENLLRRKFESQLLPHDNHTVGVG